MTVEALHTEAAARLFRRFCWALALPHSTGPPECPVPCPDHMPFRPSGAPSLPSLALETPRLQSPAPAPPLSSLPGLPALDLGPWLDPQPAQLRLPDTEQAADSNVSGWFPRLLSPTRPSCQRQGLPRPLLHPQCLTGSHTFAACQAEDGPGMERAA